MRSLIERRGAVATVAPSMREVPIDENPGAFAFAEELLAGNVDVMVFMTGVGARTLREAVETRFSSESFLAALGECTIVVRGPKPVAVLREWNVRVDHRAVEPNTWREVLSIIDSDVPVENFCVAIQEYGEPSDEFYRELEQRGARVLPVPVYRWAFPVDVEPLYTAIRSTVVGGFDVLLFTSAQQVKNVLEAADQIGLRDEWLTAAGKCRIGSIGPTASDTLRSSGLHVDVEASPPKMGQLVLQTIAGTEDT